MQEYLSHGMYQTAGYYVIAICVLFIWNKIVPRDLAFVSDSLHVRLAC